MAGVWIPSLWSGPGGPQVSLRRAREAGAPPGGDGLLVDLVSYWKLDEASGTRVDAHGANDLSEVGTVGATTGKLNDAAVTSSGNPDYLRIAPCPASLLGGDVDFTCSAWIYLTTDTTSNRYPVGNSDLGNNTAGWSLRRVATSKFAGFSVVHSGGSVRAVVNSTFGVLAINTWYHLIGWHDAANDLIGISVNGSVATTAHSNGMDTNGALNFEVGGDSNGNSSFWNGRIDEVGFWSRVLTSDERTTLYGAGTPPAYETFT